jgi:VanZ family protein
MLKLVNVIFLIIYCSFIYWLSSKTTLPTPKLYEHQDKIFHLGAYFMMGILAWNFFSDYFSSPRVAMILSILFCSLYGISDEWHQSFVPGRDSGVMDWVADTLGGILAMGFVYVRISYIKRKGLRN